MQGDVYGENRTSRLTRNGGTFDPAVGWGLHMIASVGADHEIVAGRNFY